MLTNAYFLAKIGADTAENEQHLAEILPIGRAPVGLALERAELAEPPEELEVERDALLHPAPERIVRVRFSKIGKIISKI